LEQEKLSTKVAKLTSRTKELQSNNQRLVNMVRFIQSLLVIRKWIPCCLKHAHLLTKSLVLHYTAIAWQCAHHIYKGAFFLQNL